MYTLTLLRGLTASDHFCGLGGWTTAAANLGVRVLYGLNHWDIALETYRANHRDVDTLQTSIELCDPTLVPGSDILLTSPECTQYSDSNGRSREQRLQLPLWEDPVEAWRSMQKRAQSRVLIHQVARFAGRHRYPLIFFENVTELGRDREFTRLIEEMEALEYQIRQICLDSMHAGAAASRSRTYLVFARKGIKLPAVDFTPDAYCQCCDEVFPATQDWGRQQQQRFKWGDYGVQYCYRCPRCRRKVVPKSRPATDALDLSLPAVPIRESRVRTHASLVAISEGIRRFEGRPFVRTYNGNPILRTLDLPLPTITTHARLALCFPQTDRLEDCLHRFLQPQELKIAMGFPPEYVIRGDIADQTMQIGNAVAVPTVEHLLSYYLPSLVA